MLNKNKQNKQNSKSEGKIIEQGNAELQRNFEEKVN
jgi:hypothetical protein